MTVMKRHSSDKKKTGDIGEALAAEYLRKQGYKIHETKYRRREGEIDIVAQDKDCLVFVEVRTRTGSDFGSPEESITAAKKEKLTSMALYYLLTHSELPSLWRIDVVAVELDKNGVVSRIEVIRDAVS
jgi:putative endonuclease